MKNDTSKTKPPSEDEQLALWSKRRVELLIAADFKCSRCGNRFHTLRVRQAYELVGIPLWDYPDSAFACFCEGCYRKLSRLFDESTPAGVQ